MKNKYSRHSLCTPLPIVLWLMLITWSAVGLGQDSTERQDPWTPYKIIADRNMFSRQRNLRAERSNRNDGQINTPPPAPNPESYYVLRGIVQENGVFIAFLEDSRSSEIVRVRTGDKVARGVIKSLSLDSIEYQLEQRTSEVRLGCNLEGGQGTLTMAGQLESSQTSASSPTAVQQGTSTPDPTGSEEAILKQLMERRQQQIGQ